ncbi:GxxExxY protein [Salibacter halophilus]|uniref:GxxExxY protein n=1 Tax=Salibacter halophilus TaxID=1803916 RepID=A0A6N6MC08_9FLAO|nr:GxxExxY protein [Salibacter halophilus]KAB1066087.1 GxxExxY protein [Salibacter halophilus]
MNYRNLSEQEETIGRAIVNASFTVHKSLGPGLLEKVYEVCLSHELRKKGFGVKRQVSLPIVYDGIEFKEGLKLDLLINNLVIVELKAVEIVNPVWESQIISHLKLTDLNLGYLINFNVPLIKNRIRRYRN